MSNHGVLCQTNVSLYLQFLNCASKNCLFLILFSLCLSLRLLLHPAVSVKSAFILPRHFSNKNASSQGSAPQNIVLSWRAYHWMLNLPQVASLVFQWSALQFSRKKEEKPTRTHRLQQYFKMRVALCVTCHGKKKKRKKSKPPKKQQAKPAEQIVHDFQGQSPAGLAKPEQNYGDSEALMKAKHSQGNKIHPKEPDTRLLLHLRH